MKKRKISKFNHPEHFRKKCLDVIIIAKGKTVPVLNTQSIEKSRFVDESGKSKQGFAYTINKILGIKQDSVWGWEDTAQECYVAFYEGYAIINAIIRAWRKDAATRHATRPDSDRKVYQWETYREDLRHEKIIAKLNGYDVEPYIAYWKKVFLPARNKQWYQCPVEDVEQLKAIEDYLRRQSNRANPPVAVCGKRAYFVDDKPKERCIQGQRITEITEDKYCLPSVDRPLLLADKELKKFRKSGGEVVPWHIIWWLEDDKSGRDRREQTSDFDEMNLFQENSHEVFSPRGGAMSFENLGYEWDNYQGYTQDM